MQWKGLLAKFVRKALLRDLKSVEVSLVANLGLTSFSSCNLLLTELSNEAYSFPLSYCALYLLKLWPSVKSVKFFSIVVENRNGNC